MVRKQYYQWKWAYPHTGKKFRRGGNAQRMRDHLNFIGELRDTALYQMVKYKQFLARSYNRRLKNKQFKYYV
ncbi:hypothetical protein LIER_35492 [Lithospermum erythrorhizon]|uniref:Uncharacterized protein n=1 Tax=Lithospermum erythrorhizon TaxID=34254 RepID=A0AAV3NT82_LITER